MSELKKSSNFAENILIIVHSMKKLITKLFAFSVVVLLTACASTKNVAYFQNVDSISLEASKGLYSAKIMPKDELTITVTSTNQQVSAQFNQLVQNTLQNGGNISSGSGSLMPFLVDNEGNINYPIVGKINVVGLTRTECQDKIQSLIKPYFSEKENPIVLVRNTGYKVVVMGEVNSSKVINVTSEKISILEALAQAGDLSIYGRRDNVLLIREDVTGQKHTARLNLNDANIINSPYYYLQQNDIVYVQPNKTKARNSDVGQSTTLWFSATSILISIASLMFNILK